MVDNPGRNVTIYITSGLEGNLSLQISYHQISKRDLEGISPFNPDCFDNKDLCS